MGADCMAMHKVYYKGEGGGFPQVRAVVSLVSSWLHAARLCTKCSNYALTNLLFGFCKSVSIFLVPSWSSSTPFYPKVLRAKERAPTPFPSIVFTFKLIVESFKEFGDASLAMSYDLHKRKTY